VLKAKTNDVTKRAIIGSFDEVLSLSLLEKAAKIRAEQAKAKGVSNCPLCAIGADNNKNRMWKLAEMDADHVTAWSKGGATDIQNCQMLCKTHNRAKGNK